MMACRYRDASADGQEPQKYSRVHLHVDMRLIASRSVHFSTSSWVAKTQSIRYSGKYTRQRNHFLRPGQGEDRRGEAYLVQYGELIDFLQNVGKDPSRLIFEDELTGLHNRRFLHSYFEHKVHWDRDDSFPISLLVVDIDLFKAINDTYGHEAGDEALKFVATLITEVAGENGYPGRFGGDCARQSLEKGEAM